MNFATLDLNLLRVFNALIIEGSTIKAGEQLGMSQPAVSAALGRLRDALDDPLFVRQSGGMVATEYALSIYEDVATFLSGLEGALKKQAFDISKEQRIFQISAMEVFSDLLLPGFMAISAQEAPGVTLALVKQYPDEGVHLEEMERVDAMLSPYNNQCPPWADRVLACEAEFIVIARSGNPILKDAGIKNGDPIPPDLYWDMQHVAYSVAGQPTQLFLENFSKYGKQRKIHLAVSSFAAIAKAVSESDAIGIVSLDYAQMVAESLKLDILGMPYGNVTVPLYLVWHKKHTHTPAQIWLRQTVLEVLQRYDVSRKKGAHLRG